MPDYRMDIYGEERLEWLEKLKKRSIIDGKTGCYLWQGNKTGSRGYGQIVINYHPYYVHRLSAYIYFVTTIEDKSITINHKHEICANANCWNPEHIYEGTSHENMQDSIKMGTHRNQNIFKTHCPSGHEYNERNTRIAKNGARFCRECDRQRSELRRLGFK